MCVRVCVCVRVCMFVCVCVCIRLRKWLLEGLGPSLIEEVGDALGYEGGQGTGRALHPVRGRVLPRASRHPSDSRTWWCPPGGGRALAILGVRPSGVLVGPEALPSPSCRTPKCWRWRPIFGNFCPLGGPSEWGVCRRFGAIPAALSQQHFSDSCSSSFVVGCWGGICALRGRSLTPAGVVQAREACLT